MLALFAAAVLFPRVDARAEATPELGLDDDLRGRVEVGIDTSAVEVDRWRLDVFTSVHTYIRPNRDNEGPVRISPRQVRYVVGARARRALDGGDAWGLFVSHQSNHDTDENDARLNRETVSYEVYGVDWVRAGAEGPRLRLGLGVWYDRGTRTDLRAQNLPFDYYLFGAQAAVSTWLARPLYTEAAVELVAHRNERHDPAYLNVAGHVDAGAAWMGEAAGVRLFLRFERLEDYRFLGDTPRHLLLLGLAIDTVSP